jgi:hypothetical protein
MLTRRTNLLLTEEEYSQLAMLSKETGESMGKLIRKALKKQYKFKTSSSRKTVMKEIEKLGKKVNTKGINYRELINYGRRF